jgi:exonuclease VII small subunit
MAFTVRDFDDLLKILETQPDWRSRLRRALFPEIDIPRALQELAAAQQRTEEALRQLVRSVERLEIQQVNLTQGQKAIEFRLEHLEQGQQRLEQSQQNLKQGQQKLEQGQQRLEQSQQNLEQGQQRLEQSQQNLEQGQQKLEQGQQKLEQGQQKLEQGQQKLEHRQGRVERDVRDLKGLSHERTYRDKADAIFGRFLRNGRNATHSVSDQLYEAVASGRISDQEVEQVLAADLLWSGNERSSKAEIVLVLEASWRAEQQDVTRAHDRTAVLRRIGIKALGVVGGREWDAETIDAALAHGIIVATNGSIEPRSWQNAWSKLLTA